MIKSTMEVIVQSTLFTRLPSHGIHSASSVHPTIASRSITANNLQLGDAPSDSSKHTNTLIVTSISTSLKCIISYC